MDKSTAEKSANITDEQIIDLYCDRNERAISETDKKYGKTLFNIAYNILYDREDCEECKNDTYFGVWNAIPPSRPALFSAFISKIMRNVAMKKYRDKTRQKRIPSEMTVSIDELHEFLHTENAPEVEYEARELGRIISEYVRDLTQRQRFIFFSRFYLAKTLSQIAKEYGVSTSTVHDEISKIKQGLKTHLERNGVYV